MPPPLPAGVGAVFPEMVVSLIVMFAVML